MNRSIVPTPSNKRVFGACLLSFMILIAPIASVGAATLRATTPAPEMDLSTDEKLEPTLFETAPPVPPAPLVTATKIDSFPVHPSGQAQPGDQITYDIAITNAGTDAINGTFTDTIDTNTTLVPGSLKVSPVAAADSYIAEQNVVLSVGAPGVLTNDFGTPAPTVGGIVGCGDGTAPFSCTTTGGGTVVLEADGSFMYTPLGVFTGTDTFTYTATNSAVGGLAPDDTALVTIEVDARPTVTTTTPADTATGVVTSANIVINFSEAVTASTSSFTINCPAPGNAQTFTVSGSGTSTITLDPTANLPAGTLCTVTVIASEISDVDTNDPPDLMALDYVFSFTTDAAPSVTTTTPTNGATNVAANTNIIVNFSENVNVTGTAAFTIECPVGSPVTYALTPAAPGGTNSFTLNPNVDLPGGVTCTVTVVATQVTDTDANDPPDQMAANHVFSFSVDAAPSVTTTTPTNGAANVAANTNITINFSENVNVTGTAAFTIECPVGSPVTYALTPAAPGGTSSFTLNPNVDLPSGVICTVTVVANQVTDVDANDPPDQMAANHVFSFTVDSPPAVTTTVPVDDAINVAKNTNIVINFNENVDVTGSSFTINCPAPGNAQPFAVSGSGTNQITLNPNSDLPPGVICTVTVIAAQVSDSDAGDPPDNPLTDYVFTFGVKPEAVNDAYLPNIVGNVGVNTDNSTEFSILANDSPNSGVTINQSGSSAQGGSVAVAADGKFSYIPPAGYEGADSFTYTITVTGAGTSDPATVSLNVAGMIWFINNGAASCVVAGCGRLSNPFSTLAAFNALNNGTGNNPAANDNIFVYENASVYTGPITLLGGQKLIGQDATATLAAISGVSVPADSFPLPAMNTGAPATTIDSSTVSVNAVNLNVTTGNNTVRGLTITTGTATSKGINGSAFGTLTTADLILSGSGPALDLNGGSLSGSFNSISSTGGTNGIKLVSINGSSTLGTGALSGATAEEFLVTSGTVALTYDGTISTSGAASRPVSISGKTTSGNVTFNGAVSGTGMGVNLDNNDGATITFRGGLTLTTTTNTGFNAINGGTIEVCDENPCNAGATGALVNTLTTTTGIALNVNSTTISANNLEFTSIASNGSSSGITLNTTGSLGGLKVKGDSGSTLNNSGGTIQNTTSHGISLTSTQHVSLDQMNIQTTGGSGINGTTVTNFAFTNGTVNNSGNANGESNIAFNGSGTLVGNNISGTLTVTNSTLTNAFDSGLDVQSNAGTISHATVTGNTITSTTSTATSKGHGINFVGTGNASVVHSLTRATITGNTVRNFPSNGGIQINYGNTTVGGPLATAGIPGDATNIITITGNTVRGNSAVNRFGTSAIILSMNGATSGLRCRMNFDVSNNGTVAEPIGHSLGTVILIGNNGYSTMTGTVNNNVIVGNNTVASPGIGGGNGIVLSSAETPDLTLTVNNNNISQVDGNGILLVGRGVTGIAKLTIKTNTVATPLSGARPGIRVDAGNNASVDDAVCVDISGNTSGGSGGFPGIGIRKEDAVATVNDFGIEGFAGGTCSAAENFIAGLNPGSVASAFTGCDGVTVGKRVLAISGDNYVSCSSAPLMFSPGNAKPSDALLSTVFDTRQSPNTRETTYASGVDFGSWSTPSSLTSVENDKSFATALSSSVSYSLSQQQLDLVASAALERWSATGLNEQQVAALHALTFEISDLQGKYLGEAKGNRILVDRDAESKGWFVDPSPLSDASFGRSLSASRFYTDPFSVPAGHVDLLTAIMHEMGHKLGLIDSYAEKDRDNLMYGYLTVGERRFAVHGQAGAAKPGTLKGPHFLSLSRGTRERPALTKATLAKSAKAAITTAPVLNPTNCGVGTIAICLGTLKAGKTVNIQFKVSVNTPFPTGVTQVSNQGSVGFDGGGPVLTDDPSEGGAADPTVTLVQACTSPPVPANMVAWWSGDNTPRDIAAGNDGTLNGDATYAAGKVLQGFSLDGTGDFVEAPDSVGLSPTGSISIDAFVNPATLVADANGRTIVSKYDAPTAGASSYLLRMINGGQIQFVVYGPGGENRSVTTPGAITAGVFTHVAATFDNATDEMKVYVNSADTLAPLGGGSTPITSIVDSTTPVRIGALRESGSLAGFFAGIIDEVEIFNVVLTPTQVLDVYSADSGGKCKPSDLTITKTHTDPFTQGQPGSYTITVSNDGPSPTTGDIEVTDTLPTGLTATSFSGTGWTCDALPALRCERSDSLASGDSYPSITLNVDVASNAPDSVTNTVTVTGGDLDKSDNTKDDLTNITLIPKLAVTKSADAASVSAGTSIGFTVVVSNSSDANTGTATSATLTDNLPAGTGIDWSISPAYAGPGTCSVDGSVGSEVLNCSFGDLAAGASASVHVTSGTSSASCSTYNNSGTAAATNHGNVTSTQASTTVQCASLTVTKTEDAATVNAGQTMGFNIVVSNSNAAGTGTATAVTLSDSLPAGTGVDWSINPAYAGPGTCSIDGAVGSEVLNCSFGDMAPGASITVEVESATGYSSCGTYANTATASSSNHANTSDNGSITVQCPALTMTKTEGAALVNTGSQISFTIQVNNSNVAGTGTATNVELADTLPSGTGVSWSIDASSSYSGTCDINSGVLECAFGDMAPGGSNKVVVVSNTTGASCGPYANTATLTADNHPNVEDGATTTVQCPDLTMTKTADSASVQPGNDIGFTITVQNSNAAGTIAATAVTLEDPLPAGPGVSWSLTPGYSGTCSIDPPGQTLNCNVGTLDPGESATVHVTSNTTEQSCGTFSNTATVTSTNHESIEASDAITVACGALVVVGSSGVVNEDGLNIYEVRNQLATIRNNVANGTVTYRYSLPATQLFENGFPATLRFRIRYRDPGNTTHVQVLLKSTEVVADGRETLYAFDSDGPDSGGVAAPANGPFNQTVDRSFTLPGPHVLHGRYGYYLEVIITKTGSNPIDAGFIGCAISTQPINP